VSNGYYQVTVTSPDPLQPGVSPSFSITANPIGIQVGDTACAAISVNQLGSETAQTSAGVDNSTTCWGI